MDNLKPHMKKEDIKKLIKLYEGNRDHFISPSYNETQLRNDFLDRLFELLGWDIKNTQGKSTNEREVILEEPLKASVTENSKKPDYTFRLYSERKFFVEAKKPSVHIETDSDTAKQVRRYGFTAKLKISVVSNFEYLLVYDCSEKVEEADTYSKCLIDKIHYTEYEARFEELKKYLGKDAVYSGKFDEQWKSIEDKIKHFSINNLFLDQINEWRRLLGEQIYKYLPSITQDKLNDYVQGYLNSIIFLRVCEDRNIEEYKTLLQMANKKDFQLLLDKFIIADKKYNSGLFNHHLSNEIVGNISSVFWTIIKQLYYPESPYSFSVFTSDILGNIYEIFLSETLAIKNNQVELIKKPEHIDRDIITTPNFIIKEILKKCIKPNTVQNLNNIKIADISCGSGAFLLEAYQLLNDLLIDSYLKEDPTVLVKTDIDTYKIPFKLKRELLIKTIYGNDRDYNAVQAARFGLLLKLLEGEDSTTLDGQHPLLPDLSENITFGNSLVKIGDISDLSSDEVNQINPYNFSNGPFDVIVGNPPYMMVEDIKNLTPLEYKVYPELYKSACKQYDKYYLFVEKGISLLKPNGVLGYILPSKFMKIGAGKELRRLLSDKKLVTEVVSFGANQVFVNKSTYTCLLFLKNTDNDKFKFHEVKDLDQWKVMKPEETDSQSISSADLTEANWVLLAKQLRIAYKNIFDQSKILPELVGIENIINGIQTSANKVFVINPSKSDGNYVYFCKNGKEYKIEKELTRPYFETSSGLDNLNTYRECKANSLVIYPYKKVSDEIHFIEIDELKSSYSNLFSYLSEYKEVLKDRDIKPTPITDNEWYRYGRHQSLDKLDSKKIIVGVLSIGDKYAVDLTGIYISSGGTAGYCGIVIPESSPYSIYYLQAILNSKYVEWIATLVGDIFRGGYFAHGTGVLEKLPIRKINFDNSEDKRNHDEISDLQKKLIAIQAKIDESGDNERERTTHERMFVDLRIKLNSALQNLYNLGSIDSSIPLIKNLYETD